MNLSRNLNIDPKDIVLIISIILLGLLLIDTCNKNYELNKEISYLNDEISEYSLTNSRFSKTIYQDSIIIYNQKINLINQKKANEIINNKYASLKEANNKNINRLIDLKTNTNLKLDIDIKDSLLIEDSEYKLKLPKHFNKSNEYYFINGVINRLGYLQIDSLSIKTNIILFESDTIKSGLINKLLNNKSKVLRLKIDNPYVNISGLNNYRIEHTRNIKRNLILASIFGIACTYVGYRIKH